MIASAQAFGSRPARRSRSCRPGLVRRAIRVQRPSPSTSVLGEHRGHLDAGQGRRHRVALQEHRRGPVTHRRGRADEHFLVRLVGEDQLVALDVPAADAVERRPGTRARRRWRPARRPSGSPRPCRAPVRRRRTRPGREPVAPAPARDRPVGEPRGRPRRRRPRDVLERGSALAASPPPSWHPSAEHGADDQHQDASHRTGQPGPSGIAEQVPGDEEQQPTRRSGSACTGSSARSPSRCRRPAGSARRTPTISAKYGISGVSTLVGESPIR